MTRSSKMKKRPLMLASGDQGSLMDPLLLFSLDAVTM